MASKYPGFQILYEVADSRADLAQSYGVSERTIYRWLARAAKETGETPKPKYPGAKRLASFKGTRAEAAAKFGVSERTIYRWLNKARGEGQQIASRLPSSKNPGISILDEPGTNITIAQKFGVSTRTVQRWKQQAREELKKQEPEQTVEDIFEASQEPFEEPKIEQPGTEQPKQEQKEEAKEEYNPTEELLNILYESDVIREGSIFSSLSPAEQLEYLDFYVQWQYDQDEHQFYNEERHKIDFSPDFVSTINMWGFEFEDWVERQYAWSVYDDPFMMP